MPSDSSRSVQVTLRHVADRAGVHPATVSRALSPQTRQMVGAATLERVLDAALELNYRTNIVARSLRTQRTSTVGVVIPESTNPALAHIVPAIDNVLEESHYASLVAYTGEDEERIHNRIEQLRQRGVNGLIVASAHIKDPILDALEAEEVPMVQVYRRTKNKAIPSVVADDSGGTRAVVDHLTGLGHTKIACVAGPQAHSLGRAPLTGFRAAMRRAGLPGGMVAMTAEMTAEEGARACASLLAEHPDLTAVFAANDLLALGCCDAVAAAGMRCPDDVSVVGYSDTDMPIMARTSPPMTTVLFDYHEMGLTAAQLLLRRLQADRSPSSVPHLELEGKLIVRGSTAPPR